MVDATVDVTGRKLAELEQQRTRAADAIIVIDPETLGFLDFNDEACRYLGYSREEFAKLKITDFDVVQSAAEVKEHCQNIARGTAAIFETKHRAKNGDVLDVEIRARPIRVGEKSFLLCIWRNITDRKRAEENIRRRLVVEQTVADISHRLVNVRGEKLDDLIEDALGRAAKLINADRGYLFLVSPDRKTADNTHEWRDAGVSSQQGILRNVTTASFPWFLKHLRGGQPLVIARSAAIPKSAKSERKILRDGRVLSLILTPIQQGGKLKAVIGFDAVRAEQQWTTEDARVLRICGEMFLNTLSRRAAQLDLLSLAAKLEQRVSERTAALKQQIQERERLKDQLIEVSEREQRRIGHDLHDGLCQQLMGTALVCSTVADELKAKSLLDFSHSVKRVAELIRESVVEARRLSHGLNPVKLQSNGLMSALQELASYTTRLLSVPCRFDCPQPVLVEDSTVATHMFRIAQESVTNAVRHAKPRRIVIGLYYERDALVLSIRDDGLGLPKFQQSTDGMGMQVMQHRASMIGAKFTATRGRRRGTAVCCRLPLQGVKK